MTGSPNALKRESTSSIAGLPCNLHVIPATSPQCSAETAATHPPAK